MLALVSPAKTLDYQTALPTDAYTQPRLLQHSQELIEVSRKLSPLSRAYRLNLA